MQNDKEKLLKWWYNRSINPYTNRKILKGKKVCVPTITWKIVVFLIKILPNFIFSIASKSMAPGRYEK